MVTGLLRRDGKAGAAGVADEIESVKGRIVVKGAAIAEAEAELRDGESLRDSLLFQGSVLSADVAGDIKALDKKQADRQTAVEGQREDVRQLRRYLLSLEEPHLQAQHQEAEVELTEHLTQRPARGRALLEALIAAVEAAREWRVWVREGRQFQGVARRTAARLELTDPIGPVEWLIDATRKPRLERLLGTAPELRLYDRDLANLRATLEELEAKEGS